MTCGTGGRIDSAIGTLTETINSVTAGCADVVLITTSSCVRKDRHVGIGVLIDVVYQRRSYYSNGYPQNYFGNEYYTYGTSQPYYGNEYYSYRYSQPYFANRSTYAWANPTYRYDESWSRRHRRNGLRVGI